MQTAAEGRMNNTVQHVLEIGARPQTVFRALTTAERLSSWWTTAARGDGTTVGGELAFSFRGPFNPRMRVTEVEAPTTVAWQGVGGHDVWGETMIRFELAPNGDGTRVSFHQQLGAELDADVLAAVNFNWGYYLDSLRSFCETGRGKPYTPDSPDARVAADSHQPLPTPVEVSADMQAPPEVVFQYLTDARRYVEWMGKEAELEPWPGGVYRVQMGDAFGASGAFVEVEPGCRVTFTWGWPDGAGKAVLTGPQDDVLTPGSTRVEITLEPYDGGTRLTLLHHDLVTERLRSDHRFAWQAYLNRLAIVCAGGDPGPDPHEQAA